MTYQSLAEMAGRDREEIRGRGPLVHNITNFVVMNFTANVLLACGASPVMAHAAEEVEEMVGLASALVLNIGTLTPVWVDSMLKAGKKANELNVPVILDPVGAGATRLRTESARRITGEVKVAIVRGNASEVLSLAERGSGTKGVDSVNSVDDAADAARDLALKLDTVIAITGPEDLVTDGERMVRVANGHPMMGMVTGMGCAATAVIGAFAAVREDPVLAAGGALAYMGLAGEDAAEGSRGPGGFQPAFLDALYQLDGLGIRQRARITISQ